LLTSSYTSLRSRMHVHGIALLACIDHLIHSFCAHKSVGVTSPGGGNYGRSLSISVLNIIFNVT